MTFYRYWRRWRNGWRRTVDRFWREVARKIDPHLSQGIHIDGVKIVGDGATLQSVTVRANGRQQVGVLIQGPER